MPKRIERVEIIPVFKNKYGTLFNDNVLGPKNTRGKYLRWQWRRGGVVVIPRSGELIAVCQMYRYSIQRNSLEFPRGAIDDGEDVSSAAHRELKEEAGLSAKSLKKLGTIYADSGLIENQTAVVEAEIDLADSRQVDIEPMESISEEIIWIDISGFQRWIKSGKIKCGITLSAFSILVSHLNQGG